MEFIIGILGLVVLSGPLWLIVLAVPVALFVAYWAAKRCRNIAIKATVFTVVSVTLFLALFGDEVAGRMYLNHICATEAGVNVYQTVELPAGYWDESGKPMFRIYEGDNHETMFLVGAYSYEDGRFEYSMYVEPYSSIFHIEKTGFRLRERKTEKVLGEVINFRYWHGWLSRNLSPHNSAVSCEVSNMDEWKFNIFRPMTAK